MNGLTIVLFGVGVSFCLALIYYLVRTDQKLYWEFRKQLRSREPMGLNEFYELYYEQGPMSRDEIDSLLEIHSQHFSIQRGLIRPDDNLAMAFDMDTLGLKNAIEEHFKIHIDRQTIEMVEGTFDSIVAVVSQALGNNLEKCSEH